MRVVSPGSVSGLAPTGGWFCCRLTRWTQFRLHTRTRHYDQTNFKLTQNVKEIIGILSFPPCFSTTGCPSRRPAAPPQDEKHSSQRQPIISLRTRTTIIGNFAFHFPPEGDKTNKLPMRRAQQRRRNQKATRSNAGMSLQDGTTNWSHDLLAGSWCGRIAARQQQQPARSPCRRCARRVSAHWRRRSTAPPSGQDDTRDSSSVTLRPLQSTS